MKPFLCAAIVLTALSSCRSSSSPTFSSYTITPTTLRLPPNELEFENGSSYSALIWAGNQKATVAPRATHRFKGLPDFIQVKFHKISGHHTMITNSEGFETVPHGQGYLIR